MRWSSRPEERTERKKMCAFLCCFSKKKVTKINKTMILLEKDIRISEKTMKLITTYFLRPLDLFILLFILFFLPIVNHRVCRHQPLLFLLFLNIFSFYSNGKSVNIQRNVMSLYSSLFSSCLWRLCEQSDCYGTIHLFKRAIYIYIYI